MKKIFTLLCCTLFAAPYSFVSAQTTTMKIWKGDNITATYNTTDVDSVTFATSAADGKQDLGGGVYLINGHKFIDLDLPSGLLWAETNIGAAAAADDGEYFAWGETEPQSSNIYDWSSYKYGTSSTNLTKYNSTDKKTTLEKEDDAAYVNWGTSCRMPTNVEISELINMCTWTWTSKATSDGSSINGYTVTSTKSGNSIFLPASGYRYDCNTDDHGLGGYYWSSTLYSSGSGNAYCHYFDSDDHEQDYYNRSRGRSVRPVAEY